MNVSFRLFCIFCNDALNSAYAQVWVRLQNIIMLGPMQDYLKKFFVIVIIIIIIRNEPFRGYRYAVFEECIQVPDGEM
jgi:hypothetical protein